MADRMVRPPTHAIWLAPSTVPSSDSAQGASGCTARHGASPSALPHAKVPPLFTLPLLETCMHASSAACRGPRPSLPAVGWHGRACCGSRGHEHSQETGTCHGEGDDGEGSRGRCDDGGVGGEQAR